MRSFFLGSSVFTVMLLILLILAVSSFALIKPPVELPGEPIPVIPAQKGSLEEKYQYTSNPPTSGWYTPSNVPDGFSSFALPDPQIVDLLRIGKIVIIYNCNFALTPPTPSAVPTPEAASSAETTPFAKTVPGEKEQTMEEKEAVYSQISEQNRRCGTILAGLRKVAQKKTFKNLVIFPKNIEGAKITLLAWGRLDKLLWIDEQRIIKFIDAYRGVGAEK